MLVLSRKKNESIVIDDDVWVTVVEIRGDKVRLAVVHPKGVYVHRQEVYEAIHGGTRSNKKETQSPPVESDREQQAPAPHQGTIVLTDRHAAFVDRVAAAWQHATGAPVTRGMALERILDAVEKVGETFPWNR